MYNVIYQITATTEHVILTLHKSTEKFQNESGVGKSCTSYHM